MKSLQTLIKLHKRQLDVLLLQITELEQNKEELSQNLELLKKQEEEELAAHKDGQYAFMLDKYLQYSRDSQKKMSAQIDKLDQQISDLRDELSEQFAELKKFDIALRKRITQQLEAEQKKENMILDEFNIAASNKR